VYFNLRNILPNSGTFLPGHSVYTYVQNALQTKGTDMTKLVTVETIFYIRLEITQLYLLGQPTILGFLTRLFIVPEELWLNYYFIIPKACSVFPCSTPSFISNTTLISTNRKTSVTTAVLTNTGKILIRQRVTRKRLTDRKYNPALNAIFCTD